MKYILIAILFIFTLNVRAQKHKLIKLWETDSIIDLPESVLLDSTRHVIYASQMGINPNDKDGIGGIAKISLNGKDIDTSWITGLNSPKGLGRYNNKLYAADLTDVDVIDIDKSKVEKIIPIEGAKFLNDITVSEDGIVYVSDSQTHKIHRIENGIPAVYLENIDGLNGLKVIGTDLYIAGGKIIWKADSKKKLTKVTELPNSIDGVEPVGNGDFLYSSWGGYIYYGSKDGTNELLLDTHIEKKNSADINYDPAKHILYIPTFWKKSVAAYRLE